MTSRWSRRLGASTLVLAALTIPSLASAQGDDAQRSAARAFATDGLSAYNAGHYEKAIDLFTRAESLVHAPPHQLFIARSSVKLGKLVHAKELYVKMTREELPSTAPRAFVDAQASATTELAEIEPRIPTLTIIVAGPGAEGAKVTMDGVEVPSALIGASQPADPGAHTLRASSSGWKPAEAEVRLAEKGVESTTLTLDKTEPVPAKAEHSELQGPSGIRKAAPFIAFGVGVAGLAVGTVFLFKNRGDRDDADALCTGGLCPAARRNDIQSLDDSADSAQTISWIGYGVGAASVAVGAALLLLNRSSSSAKTTGTVVTPWFDANSGGIAGRF